MEALNCDEMLQDTQQSLYSTEMAYSMTANEKWEHVERRQQPTMRQVVYTFLDNLKLRFGEESSEVMSILNILGTFREGRLSKKDTLVAIRLALGDQADLKQDLLNILFHKDADWGMGDFDFGSHQPFSQGIPSPQFLQPAHQPQMRLPPISPLWYEASQNYSSTYSEGVFGSGVHGVGGLPLSSSMHQTPGQFCHPNAFTSPVLTESASFGPHMRSHEEDKIPERQQHGVEIITQRSRSPYNWEDIDQPKEPKASYSQPWCPVASSPMLDHAQPLASNHFDSPSLSRETHLFPNSSPEEGQVATTSPSVLGVPVAVPIGKAINDMPPPSKKRCRESSRVQVDVKEDISEDVTPTASPTSTSTTTVDQPFVLPKPKKRVMDENKSSHGRGPYIHSLCGKGFSSRSRVKKHHWGNKLDNLETTTGCWAKNNKPSVSWNEHPSCKGGMIPSRPLEQAPSAASKRNVSAYKAPMAPLMVPESKDFSLTVADTPHQYQENQPYFEGLSSYRSHQLPTRTSLDNLLTAVNVASEIDAPRPQGRIDSVVSHLDAQAAAAEDNKQYITNWQSACDDHVVEPFAHDRQHPYTSYGLGLQGTQVPVNMALPGLNELYPYTLPTRSFADSHRGNDRDLVYAGANRGHATLRSPSSPGPDEEGRQL